MTNRNYFLSAAAISVLAACSSGSNPVSGSDPDPGEDVILSMEASDTFQAALHEGQTVKAQAGMMTAVLVDRATGAAVAIDADSFGMRLPGEDGGIEDDVVLVLDGEEVTFTASDRSYREDGVTYYGWSQDSGGTRYSLWSWSNGTADEAISVEGDAYAAVWEVFREAEDGSEYTAYNVFGTHTPDDVLPTLEDATYSGYGAMKAYPDGSYDGYETVDRLEGNVSMTVAFGAGTVSGSMDDLRFGWTGDSAARDPVDGSIAMLETSIGDNGRYAGTLEGDAAFLEATDDGVFTGTYSGDFFGPEAEETAGALTSSFSAGGTDYVGAGFFDIRRND